MSTYDLNKLRSFYYEHRLDVSLDCGDETFTVQSAKDECDINNIIAQYQRTGILDHINKATADFLDLPDTYDYQSSLHTVMAAEHAFSELPSVIRDEYGNDAGAFLRDLHDPDKRSKMEDLGIFNKSPAPASAPVPPAPDAGK